MANILVIDDEINVRMSIKLCLATAGNTVSLATNGKEGMKRMLFGSYDLVITDVFMPEQEGMETIMELRKKYPHVPIIAISGGSIAAGSMLMLAKELGVQEALQKPFGYGGLLA